MHGTVCPAPHEKRIEVFFNTFPGPQNAEVIRTDSCELAK